MRFVPLKHSCAQQAERPSLVLSLTLFLCVICTNALQPRWVGQIKGLSSSVFFLRKCPEVHPQGTEEACNNHLPKCYSSLQQFVAWCLSEPQVMSVFSAIPSSFLLHKFIPFPHVNFLVVIIFCIKELCGKNTFFFFKPAICHDIWYFLAFLFREADNNWNLFTLYISPVILLIWP